MQTLLYHCDHCYKSVILRLLRIASKITREYWIQSELVFLYCTIVCMIDNTCFSSTASHKHSSPALNTAKPSYNHSVSSCPAPSVCPAPTIRSLHTHTSHHAFQHPIPFHSPPPPTPTRFPPTPTRLHTTPTWLPPTATGVTHGSTGHFSASATTAATPTTSCVPTSICSSYLRPSRTPCCPWSNPPANAAGLICWSTESWRPARGLPSPQSSPWDCWRGSWWQGGSA